MRSWVTTLGLAALAIGAVWVAKTMIGPTQEKVERGQSVLNAAAAARVVECRILEDSELPEGLERPGVGGRTVYLLVAIHYPGYAAAPGLANHSLIRVNGRPDTTLQPVHTASEPDEDGATGYLTFRTTLDHSFAKLIHGDKVLAESLHVE